MSFQTSLSPPLSSLHYLGTPHLTALLKSVLRGEVDFLRMRALVLVVQILSCSAKPSTPLSNKRASDIMPRELLQALSSYLPIVHASEMRYNAVRLFCHSLQDPRLPFDRLIGHSDFSWFLFSNIMTCSLLVYYQYSYRSTNLGPP